MKMRIREPFLVFFIIYETLRCSLTTSSVKINKIRKLDGTRKELVCETRCEAFSSFLIIEKGIVLKNRIIVYTVECRIFFSKRYF